MSFRRRFGVQGLEETSGRRKGRPTFRNAVACCIRGSVSRLDNKMSIRIPMWALALAPHSTPCPGTMRYSISCRTNPRHGPSLRARAPRERGAPSPAPSSLDGRLRTGLKLLAPVLGRVGHESRIRSWRRSSTARRFLAFSDTNGGAAVASSGRRSSVRRRYRVAARRWLSTVTRPRSVSVRAVSVE